ncbi:MAG: hypothetical protein KC983_08120 [Phycisphaerales bacterium]|nr:hypothetical protein [Phycisphaerales bacterium]
MSEQACTDVGGRYEGDNVLCADFICDDAGACCDLQFGTCTLMFADECTALYEEFRGDDTACEPDACPPVGACCLGDFCNVFTEQYCSDVAGCYQGDGTMCNGVMCVDCNMNGVEDSCETMPTYNPLLSGDRDTCAQALPITNNVMYDGTTVGASSDTVLLCGPFASYFDVYYAYIPRSTGYAFLSVQDFGPETFAISVHSDCPASEGNRIACSATSPQGLGFNVVKGTEYIIRIAALGLDAGQYVLTLTGPAALTNDVDDNADGQPDECECRADVTGDGIVDSLDFAQAMNQQGSCPPNDCPSDVNQDGTVDTQDLMLISENWGPRPFLGPLALATAPVTGKGPNAGASLRDQETQR